MKNIKWLAITLFFISCNNQNPREITIGQDACAHCQMTIVDSRFSAQLITSKGKYYPFDDIFCLSTFINESQLIQPNLYQSYVSDFTAPGSYLKMEKAYYLYNSEIRTPMGGHTASFSDTASRDSIFSQIGGEKILAEDAYIRVINNHE